MGCFWETLIQSLNFILLVIQGQVTMHDRFSLYENAVTIQGPYYYTEPCYYSRPFLLQGPYNITFRGSCYCASPIITQGPYHYTRPILLYKSHMFGLGILFFITSSNFYQFTWPRF